MEDEQQRISFSDMPEAVLLHVLKYANYTVSGLRTYGLAGQRLTQWVLSSSQALGRVRTGEDVHNGRCSMPQSIT
jgi:hypothetical protein